MTADEELTIKRIQKESLIRATLYAFATFGGISMMNHRLALSRLFEGDNLRLLVEAGIGMVAMASMLLGTIMVAINSVNVFWTLHLLGEDEE